MCSGEMLDFKILQSEWLRTFWPISEEQLEDLYRNTVNKINFNYRTNSGQTNYQIFI